MKTVSKFKNKRERKQAKKQNAKLYPIYKMFSWDLLFFYSTKYLFLTITKGISAGDILKVEAFYPLFTIIMQIPAIICGDCLGRKRSIIIGNAMVALHILLLIIVPGATGLFIANIAWAFGYSLKTTQETNLLYDSTSTRGGEGIYPRINGKGASGYYILDGTTSLIAGYLFVINQYIPMCMCLIFTLIATFLSFGFKDIYKNDIQEEKSIRTRLADYRNDFKYSIKAIFTSKRLRILIFFFAIFNSIIDIMGTYRGNILTSLNVKPEMFSIIIATVVLIAGFATMYQNKFHKKYRNKSLGILAITHMLSIILMGALLLLKSEAVLPLVLILLATRQSTMSLYYVLSERYLKNFSTPKTRGRISFASEIVTNIVEGITMFGAGILLDIMDIGLATLWIGLLFLMIFVITLDKMRTRVGLRPNQYSKEDIELE